MKNPFQFREILKDAQARERLGDATNSVARQAGFENTTQLAEAAREEARQVKPKRLTEAEQEAHRLQQIASQAQGDAEAIRSEIEEAQIELDRDLRNLHAAKTALSQFEEYAAGIDSAIAAKIAYLADPAFIISTFSDTYGHTLRAEEEALESIIKLRLRKELLTGQRAAFTKNVIELEKRVK